MTKRMLIDAVHPEEMRVVIADNAQIHEFDFVTAAKKQIKGNIYLAKITRVEPSLQAAFVEYGGGKQGFLPFSEIHPDYYQIPVSDRNRLMREAEDAASAKETAEEENDHAPARASARHQEAPPEEAADGEEGDLDTPPLTAGTADLFAAPAADTANAEEKQASEAGADEQRDAYLAERSADIATASAPVETTETHSETQESPSEGAEAAPAAPNGKVEEVQSAKTEEIETLPGGDENEETRERRQKKQVFHKRYRIQEVIKRNQVMLVQVIKEERGNKGVSLSSFLSLPGRYCVLMPNSPKDGGISRKISDADTRKRLKSISTELKLAQGMSVIIRTAGIDRTRAEIKRDFDYLVKLWNRIRELTLASNAPALVYEESNLLKRSLRDLYANDIEEIQVEGDAAYKTAKEFMKLILPSHTPKIKHYKADTPLLYAYGIEDQLLMMHDPVVKLRSGGYIVINPTEALISIDVNSGRATSERNIEETATKTNLEAAQEIARQLRLRDLAGLIVIDFIDMMESRNRRAVEKGLKDALRHDRAKIQLGRISPFGLLEMSRQRLRPSLSEASNSPCQHCAGRGVVRSSESLTLQIIRQLEKEAGTGQWQTLRVAVPEGVAIYMLNAQRELLTDLEKRHGVRVEIRVQPSLQADSYTLDKVRNPQAQPATQEEPRERDGRGRLVRGRRGRGRGRRGEREDELPTADAAELPLPEEVPAEAEDEAISETAESVEQIEGEDGRGRGRGRRGRRGGRGGRGGRKESPGFVEEQAGTPELTEAGASEEAVAEKTEGEEDAQPRRTRGRTRGGRRWRERSQRGQHRDEPRESVENGSQPDTSDGGHLPAFARDELPDRAAAPRHSGMRVTELPARNDTPPPPPLPPAPERKPASTKRAGEARKGWWQSMIELED